MSTSKRRSSSGEGSAPRVKIATTSLRRRPGAKSRVALKTASDESQNREQLIAEAAYLRSEQRNFEPGYELDDWLAAELEIDSLRPARQESIDEADIIGPIP